MKHFIFLLAFIFAVAQVEAQCPKIDAASMVATSVSSTSADLAWTAVDLTGVTGYRTSVRKADVLLNAFFNSVTPSVTATGLSPSTNYAWRTRTVCGTVVGNLSAQRYFTTNSALQAPPSLHLDAHSKTWKDAIALYSMDGKQIDAPPTNVPFIAFYEDGERRLCLIPE